MNTIRVRPAVPSDTALVFALVVELAAYERLDHEVRSTPEMIGAALFGGAPRLFCEVVEHGGEAAGMALWFYNYSTFEGRHGLFVEDLYVRPGHRGAGLGKALLRTLARRCLDEGLARLQWSVLDWNAPAIAFYKAQQAEMLDEWTGCRVSGDALVRLAGSA